MQIPSKGKVTEIQMYEDVTEIQMYYWLCSSSKQLSVMPQQHCAQVHIHTEFIFILNPFASSHRI